MEISPIKRAIEAVGLQPLAKACGVTYQALQKWDARGRLPRTDWTGETDYARRISEECAKVGVDIPESELMKIPAVSDHRQAA